MSRVIRVGEDDAGAVGHYQHEDRLLQMARSGRNPDGDPDSLHAFVKGTRTCEELGEELAESFLQSATSGEESGLERLERATTADGHSLRVLMLAEGEDADHAEDADHEEDA